MTFRVTDLMVNVLPDDPDRPDCEELTEPPACHDDSRDQDVPPAGPCPVDSWKDRKCGTDSRKPCPPGTKRYECQAVTDLSLLQQQLARTLAELR